MGQPETSLSSTVKRKVPTDRHDGLAGNQSSVILLFSQGRRWIVDTGKKKETRSDITGMGYPKAMGLGYLARLYNSNFLRQFLTTA